MKFSDGLQQRFYDLYQQECDAVVFAPGRTNLIGEHLDYNGGTVLPAAISLGTCALVRRRDDAKLRIHSFQEKESGTIDPEMNGEHPAELAWMRYPVGVVTILRRQQVNVPGMDILYDSTLPLGAGLSSSASLEVVTGFAGMSLLGDVSQRDRVFLAAVCQEAEHEFGGVRCGIMDQFAVALGRKSHALRLDCRTLNFEHIEVPVSEHVFVAIDSKHRRALSDSRYNERRAECEDALKELQKKLPVETLASASEEAILMLRDPILYRRARHVVTEEQRVQAATEFLARGQLKEFGTLLRESHRSLREDLEVTGVELDALVSEALESPHCLGARMTGAGFGGCALALVARRGFSEFCDKVGSVYQKLTGYVPGFYEIELDDGVRRIAL